jgi:hypothetical protein
MSNLNRRGVKVTTFRENVPQNPTNFQVTRKANTTLIEKLRLQFKVRRSLTKHPNTCDVTIANLAPSTRVDLETKPLLVQLNAGYDDNLELLFLGDLRFGMTKQKDTNWETLLQLGDGDCMHRWARVNKSYAPGTPVKTVLRDAARSMGFQLPKNVEQDPALNQSFDNGRTSHGFTRDELTKLLSPYGYHWSIQNGALLVLRDDDVSVSSAIPIGEAYGMIGTPEFGSPPRSGKPPHMNVRMLLYPRLAPGMLVQLTSKVKNGLFRLEVVTHTGDTHGQGENSWTTEVEIKPVGTSAKSVSTGTSTPTILTSRQQVEKVNDHLALTD